MSKRRRYGIHLGDEGKYFGSVKAINREGAKIKAMLKTGLSYRLKLTNR